MGKNCADRRCISECNSFTATQAYSTLCKSKTMKEVKSGERQKHWQMRRMILGDINMPLNHITEGLEYKHTFAVRFFAVTALSSVSSSSPLYSASPAWLGLSLLFPSIPIWPCASLAPSVSLVSLPSNRAVLSRGFDTLMLLCAKDDSHLCSRCWGLMQTTVPPRWWCRQTYRH